MKFQIFFMSVLTLILLYGMAHAQSHLQGRSSQELNQIFAIESKRTKSDLGPQCRFETLKEAKAYEAEYGDADTQIPFETFIDKVAVNGLLDVNIFRNADGSLPDGIQYAIDNISEWTARYARNGWPEKKETCFMNANEVFSLFYYTGEGYKALNAAIRKADDGSASDFERTRALDLRNRFAIIGKNLSSALDKMKSYDGFVKRGQGFNGDYLAISKLNQQYQVGRLITWAGYSSTSIFNGFPGEAQFLIRTRVDGYSACRYIASFSLVQQGAVPQLKEEEVLCKPYTKFRVLNHTVMGSIHQILMEEVPYETRD